MLALGFGSTVIVPFSWASLVALLVPIVTAFVVRYRAGDHRVHVVVAALLAAVLATVAMLTNDIPEDTVLAVAASFIGVYGPMVVAYVGAYKAFHIDARLAPTVGI